MGRNYNAFSLDVCEISRFARNDTGRFGQHLYYYQIYIAFSRVITIGFYLPLSPFNSLYLLNNYLPLSPKKIVITREKAIGLYLPKERSDYLPLTPFNSI